MENTTGCDVVGGKNEGRRGAMQHDVKTELLTYVPP